ncbi:uncharacterized protein [Bemisia tabaci]|uniref:uncharacterized protein n=1 Tax=Bemisia tabaci TaxID=7038 RepID=UPI003B27BE7C
MLPSAQPLSSLSGTMCAYLPATQRKRNPSRSVSSYFSLLSSAQPLSSQSGTKPAHLPANQRRHSPRKPLACLSPAVMSNLSQLPKKSKLDVTKLSFKTTLNVIHPHRQFIQSIVPSYRPVNGGGAKVEYPRLCEQCCKTYLTKQSFYNHKKICVPTNSSEKNCTVSEKSIVYPRSCEQCCKTYKSKQSFFNHKKLCIPFCATEKTCTVSEKCISVPEKPPHSPTSNSIVLEEGISFDSFSGSPEKSAPVKSIQYPRICDDCLKSYTTKQSFYRHRKFRCAGIRCKKLICPVCKKNLTRKTNLKTHQRNCKENETKIMFLYPRKCKNCCRTYKNKVSYCSHKKKCQEYKAKLYENNYHSSCATCHASFSCELSFKKHQTLNCENFNVKCTYTNCNRVFRSSKSMFYHLNSFHLKEATKIIKFDNFAKFKEWKKKVEHESFSYQRKVRGTVVFKEESIHYYKCMFYRKKRSLLTIKQQRRTARKRRYGQIPEGSCPSQIIARVKKSGEVEVKYISCHCHSLTKENNIFHRWQPETRAEVKRLLDEGVSADVIRKKFIMKKGEKIHYPLKEHHMTTREILRYKFLLKKAKRKDDDDATSIKKRVDLMTDEEKKDILIYKPQGCSTYIGDANFDSLPYNKDLFVYGFQTERQLKEMQEGSSRGLCIDATHKTNRYDFYLLNIVIPDEFGNGLVVAQFVTNHLDTEVMSILFRSIKKRCPHLPVHTVMTDDDPALWESFKSVFSKDNPNWDGKHLLCKWHILNAWKKNLNKIRRPMLRRLINNYLRVLIDEKNVQNFKIKLKNFLKKFSGSQYSRFLKYFRTYYLNGDRPKLWAMCYRNYYHCGLDTNNFVESFHRVLKSRLKRSSNLRMDDLIELLEDMEHERYLKLEDRRLKGEPHKDFNKPDARHSRSMKIPHSAITTLSNNKWLVKSVKRKEVLYLVTKKIEQCNLDHCYDKCNNMSCFGLCVHLYDCNCPDKVGMCKHIHRIHSFSTRNEHRSVTIISNDNENAQISNESCEKDEEAMNPECNAIEISTIDVEEEVCLTQFCRSDDNDGTSANQNNSSNASNKDEAAQFDILVDELRKLCRTQIQSLGLTF